MCAKNAHAMRASLFSAFYPRIGGNPLLLPEKGFFFVPKNCATKELHFGEIRLKTMNFTGFIFAFRFRIRRYRNIVLTGLP